MAAAQCNDLGKESDRAPVASRWMAERSSVVEKLMSFIRKMTEAEPDSPNAYRDPLSHPALKAMSARELADLPFPRPCVR